MTFYFCCINLHIKCNSNQRVPISFRAKLNSNSASSTLQLTNFDRQLALYMIKFPLWHVRFENARTFRNCSVATTEGLKLLAPPVKSNAVTSAVSLAKSKLRYEYIQYLAEFVSYHRDCRPFHQLIISPAVEFVCSRSLQTNHPSYPRKLHHVSFLCLST